MRLGRRTLVMLAVGAASLTAAAASGLGPVGSKRLGAADAAVVACDTSAPKFTHALTLTRHASDGGYHVTGVTVGDVAAACAGGVLTVTLTQNGTSIGSGSATAANPSTTVSITVPGGSPAGPHADLVNGVDIAITGP